MKRRASTEREVGAYPGPGLGTIVRHPSSSARMVVLNSGPAYRLIAPVGKKASDPKARWAHHSTLTPTARQT